ncbi:hypothetical protein V2G26_018306 [Clonostachys chloroleuca]
MSKEVTFRGLRSGDIGLILYRHGVLYAQELGWDTRAEVFWAKIMVDVVDNFDPEKEIFWIAEREGEFVGCVGVCKDRQLDDTARLRLLLVEPAARGLGLGKKLIQKSLDFAREKGYHKMVLSTQSALTQARKLYQAAGFQKICDEDDGKWKQDGSHGEFWTMDL